MELGLKKFHCALQDVVIVLSVLSLLTSVATISLLSLPSGLSAERFLLSTRVRVNWEGQKYYFVLSYITVVFDCQVQF